MSDEKRPRSVVQRLHQVLAIEKAARKHAQQVLTEKHRQSQNAGLYAGIVRRYAPLDEETLDRLPDERQRVRATVSADAQQVSAALAEALNLVATKEWGNQRAKADLVVDGEVLVKDAPVQFLLYLEKELKDLATYIRGLPTLDLAEKWELSGESGLYETAPQRSIRYKDVTRALQLYPATTEHPAQVQAVKEKQPEGHWFQTLYSGAVSVEEKRALLSRCAELANASRVARETANVIAISEDRESGGRIMDYLFGDLLLR